MKRIIKKVAKLLNKNDKKKLITIYLMMFVGGLLETFGISMIIPIVSVLVDEHSFDNNRILQRLSLTLRVADSSVMIILLITIMAVLFITKGFFLLWEYNYISTFVTKKRLSLQVSLFDSYVKRPYEYYLNANTAEILRNISSDVAGSFEMVSDLLELLLEIVTGCFIVILIFVTSPQMAVIITFFLLIMIFVIAKILRPKLKKIGETGLGYAMKCSKWLLQALDGIKEIIVACKSPFFLEKYKLYGEKRIECDRKFIVFGKLPRILIETSSVVGMMLGALLIILTGGNIKDYLPQLSGLAFAAVKLIPSVNKISNYINNLSYKEPMLDKVLENLKELSFYSKTNEGEERPICKLSIAKGIQLRNITYSYPNSDMKIFEDLSIFFPLGKTIGFIGKSGAGKTTLVDILIGLLHPQCGSVYVNDTNIQDVIKEWTSSIGYIPQSIFMLDDTIEANIALGISEKEIDPERINKVLRETQLTEFVNSLPEGLKTVVGEKGVRISGGQKQRIGIARALYNDPEVIIFDEATSALDMETESAVMTAIDFLHGKKTVFIIAHRLQTINNCDLVFEVKNGKLFEQKMVRKFN